MRKLKLRDVTGQMEKIEFRTLPSLHVEKGYFDKPLDLGQKLWARLRINAKTAFSGHWGFNCRAFVLWSEVCRIGVGLN